jgi:hypothetical protein
LGSRARYVAEARAAEASAGAGAVTTFIHNNAYAPEELDECFERNSEGMLKNMAVRHVAATHARLIAGTFLKRSLALLAPRDGPNATQVHELALAVTYYGVTAESIASVTADKDFSVCETRQGYTDFAKVAFTITTADGSVVTIQADRCGGNNSQASALRCTARSDGGCSFIYSRNWSFLTGGGLWVALRRSSMPACPAACLPARLPAPACLLAWLPARLPAAPPPSACTAVVSDAQGAEVFRTITPVRLTFITSTASQHRTAFPGCCGAIVFYRTRKVHALLPGTTQDSSRKRIGSTMK